MSKPTVLYISLTGMGEALGKSQVFEYLKGLSKGNKIFLISFEKKYDSHKLKKIKTEMSELGINWKYFIYSNRFGIFSTLYQLLKVVSYSLILTRKNKINIVHARSMIPALMSYPLVYFFKTKLLFDIRDFSTDEKVDRGRIKKESIIYKILLFLELFLYRNSDVIVTLTQASKHILTNKYGIKEESIYVISTCASSSIFYPLKHISALKMKLNIPSNRTILLHSGSVTGWYLFNEEIEFYKRMKELDPSLLFLILNEHAHEYIHERMRHNSIKNKDYIVRSIDFEDMNEYLNISDAAIFFIKPTFSKIASAPTKFAEYVSAQLPSITNIGIGDMQEYMTSYKVGHIVDVSNITDKDIILSIGTTKIKQSNYYIDLFDTFLDKDKAINEYDDIYKFLNDRRGKI